MVVAVSIVFALSLAFAPRRGVAPRAFRLVHHRKKTARENVLRTLYLLGEDEGRWNRHVPSLRILEHRNMSPRSLASTLSHLEREGLVTENFHGHVALTPRGVAEGKRITRLHRLWELYLTRKLEIAPDHVHDDAEEIEHILTPDLEARLVAILDDPEHDPHQRAIPGIEAHP